MSSRYRPWKAFERRHARLLGGIRLWRPDFGDSAPDGESGFDVWDCKVRASFSVVGLFLAAEKRYRDFANGRRFHLALYSRAHPRAGDFVLLRAEDFAALVEAEIRLRQLEAS